MGGGGGRGGAGSVAPFFWVKDDWLMFRIIMEAGGNILQRDRERETPFIHLLAGIFTINAMSMPEIYFATTTMRQRNRSSGTRKHCKNIKVMVYKWSSHNEYSKNAITNNCVAWKHGYVVAAVLSLVNASSGFREWNFCDWNISPRVVWQNLSRGKSLSSLQKT